MLINDNFEPSLTGFELQQVLQASEFGYSNTNYRWMAPEYLQGVVDKRADIWAFGMTILEVPNIDVCLCSFKIILHPPQMYTKRKPYFYITRDTMVLLHVRHRKIPDKPHMIPDDIWKVLKKCWAYNPDERPVIQDIYNMLVEIQLDMVNN